MNEWLLSARLTHKHGHITVTVTYASTKLTEASDKEVFYDQLSSLVQTTRPHDQLVTLDDVSAISGTTHREIVGPYGSGVRMTILIICYPSVVCMVWLFLAPGSDDWMFTDGPGSPTMVLPGRRLITHLPGSRTDMHPTGCFVVLKCPPIPTTCLSFLTRHFASRCQKRATHPFSVTTHNALPPTLSCSIAIMLQLLIHLTASSQPLTTLTKLGPPPVMLSEAVLTKFLVCEKIYKPWLSGATYEVLQDKQQQNWEMTPHNVRGYREYSRLKPKLIAVFTSLIFLVKWKKISTVIAWVPFSRWSEHSLVKLQPTHYLWEAKTSNHASSAGINYDRFSLSCTRLMWYLSLNSLVWVCINLLMTRRSTAAVVYTSRRRFVMNLVYVSYQLSAGQFPIIFNSMQTRQSSCSVPHLVTDINLLMNCCWWALSPWSQLTLFAISASVWIQTCRRWVRI